MSDGHGKKEPEVETTYITIDPEEFNRVCKRLNQMLSARVDKAWEKKHRRPTRKMIENHIEATKDAFAFVHLLDLVEQMSQEIYELRSELSVLDQTDDEVSTVSWSKPVKKQFMN